MDVAEKQNKQQSELHSKLWSMANDLRGTMDASEFKNYILGLIFYRFLSERLVSYIEEKLLNKDVKAVYSAKTKRCSIGRHLMSLYYKDDNGIYKSFEEEILKSGLAVIYKYSNLANELNKFEDLNKMREIAKTSNNYNLVILDTFNGEYYEPDCQYIQGHGSTELIDLKSGAYGYKRAKCPQ